MRDAKIVELWKDGVSCLSISQQMEERMSEWAVIAIVEQAGFEVERKKYWPPSPFKFNGEELKLIKRQSDLKDEERPPLNNRGDRDRWYLNEALFTGVAVSKYKNGQKKTEVTFKEGLEQSQTFWFTNGKKFKERTYEYHKSQYPKVRFKIYNKPSEVEGNHLREEMVDEP